MLKLIIEDDEGRKTVVPFVRDEITIGRQEGNTIRLTERNVSRRHARLMRQNGHILIEDLGSYNGIRVNGDRITGQVQVNDGDLIQIGDYDLAIQREEELKGAAGGATVPLEATAPRATVKDATATVPALPTVDPPQAADEDVQDAPEEGKAALGEDSARNQSTSVIRVDQIAGNRPRQVVDLDASEAPRLVVMNTDFAGREFPCTRTEIRIGRTDDNDIALDHRSLSRTHCKVVREDTGEWRVIDLQSANGIMVNGESYTQVTLRPGDVLELGHVKMKFLAPGEPAAPERPTTSITAEQDEPVPASRVPMFAVGAAVLVLVIGVGGYALLKSGQQPIVRPPKNPLATGGGAGSAAAGGGAVEVVDVGAQQLAAAEKLIATAKADIDAYQWDKAEAALRECTIDEKPCPEAAVLLGTLQGEKAYRTALDDAEQLIALEELEKANTQLEAAKGTVLLRTKLADLQMKYAKKVEEKLKRAAAVNPVRPSAGTLEAQKLFEEAQKDQKEKQYQAMKNKSERCVKADPRFADCYRLLGTASAFLAAQGDGNYAPVVKYYKQYLSYAPPDDPMVPKVKARLKEIEESLKQQ